MFLELVKQQTKYNKSLVGADAAKKSWRRQRRVQKFLSRAVV